MAAEADLGIRAAPQTTHPFFGKLSFAHGDPEMGERIWRDRYALYNDQDERLEDTLEQSARRIARAVAAPDPEWEDRFFDAIRRLEFVPGGRIWAGAGLEGKTTTYSNCYVYPISDSRGSINQTLGWGMETLARGGGVGFNFSTLRPKGSVLKSNRGHASGPNSFVTVFNQGLHSVADAICLYNGMYHTIEQGGSRRAACMGQLHVTHPDIREFIHWKAAHPPLGSTLSDDERFLSDAWQHFNVSVQVSDPFMKALDDGGDIALTFGHEVHEHVSAQALWEQITQQAWASGDPGLFFIDRANRESNSFYYQSIVATNPCGEVPLPAFGTCNLGSINLKAHLKPGLEGRPVLDEEHLARTAETAVVFLDDVLEVNHWPVEETRLENERSRRLGVGVLGLADVCAEMGVSYGSYECLALTERIFDIIKLSAYRTSVVLAEERGTFAAYDRDAFMDRPFVRQVVEEDPALGKEMARFGMRNVCVLSVAPTGTISLVAGASSGIEPIFARAYTREDRVNVGGAQMVSPYALEPSLRTAGELTPVEHVMVQAAAQKHVDQAISKTVNAGADATVADVDEAYRTAWEAGAKGITVYRDGSRGTGVLRPLSYEETITALAGVVCRNGTCEI